MSEDQRIKSQGEHSYNLYSGFTIAIQVAGILKVLDIIRTAVVENKVYWIDIAIVIFLLITWVSQEIITKAAFVRKKRDIILSRRSKKIRWITIILYMILLITVTLLLKPILASTPVV